MGQAGLDAGEEEDLDEGEDGEGAEVGVCDPTSGDDEAIAEDGAPGVDRALV